jgi:hypothetical protein
MGHDSETESNPITQKDVLDQIQKTKNYVKEHKDELPNFLYNAMNTFSTALLAYKDAKGKKGWTKDLDWTEGQKTILEECLPRFFEIGEKKGQDGGAYPQLSLKSTTDDSLVQMAPAIDPTKISLDSAFYGIRTMLSSLDAKNKQFAKILGPTAIINSMKTDPGFGPMPPYLPIRLQFPARAILPMINAILESIRLFVSMNPLFDIKILRQILSIVLAIFDISRGEWKDGILSLLGVYSRNMLLIGVLGKTTRWVYNFISPDIQNRLEEDLYASGKSMFVGFWLWTLTVVSPDFVRIRVQELMDNARENVENFNEKIDAIEARAQQEASIRGATVKFPRVPMDRFPSFDDIQNLQSILHQPAVFCNPSFQSILKPALKIPPLRIALELMNIPTLSEKIAEHCKNVPTDIVAAAAQEFAPTVVRQEVKDEVKEEAKAEVKEEVKDEAKAEVKAEVKAEAKAEVKEEVKEEVKAEIKAEATEPKTIFSSLKFGKTKKGGSRKKSKKGSRRPQGRKEGLATSPVRRTRRRARG